MRSRLLRLRIRKRWREEDTREALEGPVPPESAAFPLDLSLGRWPLFTALAQLGALAMMLLMHIVGIGLYVDRFAIGLIAAGLLTGLLTTLLRQSAAGRHIWIAEEGVRVQRLLTSDYLTWSHVRIVETDPALSSLRLSADGASSWLSLAPLAAGDRKRVIIGVRARAEPRGITVKLRASGRRWLPFAAQPALRGIGEVLAIVAVIWAGAHTSFNLGLRCSAASGYLRTRFGAPQQRGCVVLRVSGGAERAGVRQGDLLIEFDGIPVTSGEQFSVLFQDSSKWSYVLTLLRPGVPQPVHFEFSLAKGGRLPHTPTSDPLYYFLRARWNASDGKVDGPIADYSRAIALEPAFDLAYAYRADLFTEGPRRDLPVAEKDVAAALLMSPTLGEVHRVAAYVYRDEGRRPEARQEVQKAIELDSCANGFTRYNVDCAEDYYALTTISDEPYDAIARYAEQSIEFYPGFPKPYYKAAWAYKSMGDDERAQNRARRFLAFPDSQRDPMATWDMKMLVTPPGTPLPLPPSGTPLQFFNDLGTPLPLLPPGQ